MLDAAGHRGVMPRALLQRVVAPLAIAIERGLINPSEGCRPADRLGCRVANAVVHAADCAANL